MTYLSGSIRLHWLIELCEGTQISQTKPLPGSRYVLHQNLFSVRPLKKFSYKTFFTLVCKRTTILCLPQTYADIHWNSHQRTRISPAMEGTETSFVPLPHFAYMPHHAGLSATRQGKTLYQKKKFKVSGVSILCRF